MKKIELYEDNIKKARAAWLEAERRAEYARAEMNEAFDSGADKFEKALRSQIFCQRDYYASGMRAILKILDILEDPFKEWDEIEMEDAGKEDEK